MTKNADTGNSSYSGYGIEFVARGFFSISNNSGIGQNVIIFGADMASSAHIDNKKKDFLILGKDSTDGLQDITLIAEAGYFINLVSNKINFA